LTGWVAGVSPRSGELEETTDGEVMMVSTSRRFLPGLVLGVLLGGVVAWGVANWLGISGGGLAERFASIETPGVPPDAEVGLIHGVVSDHEGNGLPGVVLRARRMSRSLQADSPSTVGAAAPEPPALETVVHEAVVEHAETRAGMYETRTDETGAYRFDELRGASWQLDAYQSGYVLEPVSSSRVHLNERLDFTAWEVITVPVTIDAPADTPASSAILLCRSLDRRIVTSYRWTPAEPFVRLAPGSYEIEALSEEALEGFDRFGSALQSSPAQRLVLTTGVTPRALHFDLKDRAGIHGIVYPPGDGVVQRSPRLHLLRLAPEEEPDLNALSRSRQTEFIRAGVRYSFLDLEPGRYVLGVVNEQGGPVLEHAVVEVGEGLTRYDLTLPPLDSTGCLQVHASAPDGGAVGELSFILEHRESRRPSSRHIQPLRNREGTFFLELPDKIRELYFSDTPEGTFSLRVHHSKYGTFTESLLPGQRELTLNLDPPGILEVGIARYRGSGYEGRLDILVERVEPDSTERSPVSAREPITAAGVRRFSKLRPGRYCLSLELKGPGRVRRFGPGTTIEVKVEEGLNLATLEIPELHSFDVTWPEGEEGTSFYLDRLDAEQRQAKWMYAVLRVGGVASFEEIPVGSYLLSTRTGEKKQMRIDVPCGDITFEPQEIDALLVVLTTESGDLGRIGLRDGDLIVGANDQRFDGEPERSLLSGLHGSNTARLALLVERDGEPLHVEVRGSDIGESWALGGRLEPVSRRSHSPAILEEGREHEKE